MKDEQRGAPIPADQTNEIDANVFENITAPITRARKIVEFLTSFLVGSLINASKQVTVWFQPDGATTLGVTEIVNQEPKITSKKTYHGRIPRRCNAKKMAPD